MAVFLAYLVQDTILDIFATLCPSSSSSVIIFSVEIFLCHMERHFYRKVSLVDLARIYDFGPNLKFNMATRTIDTI